MKTATEGRKPPRTVENNVKHHGTSPWHPCFRRKPEVETNVKTAGQARGIQSRLKSHGLVPWIVRLVSIDGHRSLQEIPWACPVDR
jgi:hypothetical protein